jgi:serine/threonine-protein kinase
LLGVEPQHEQEFRERFRCEAQAAGRLHHPSIVTVFDVGEDPDSREPYIVLEYVLGETLSRILSRQKKQPLSTALQLAGEIAEALDYAHAQGVVHRDIKPANILVTGDGHAKIADFGIAKLNFANLTLPGRVLGTPAYMAPEQLSGENVDGRSDLFSLGVMLYTMVTGHSPFPGSSATTVCFKVVNRDPVPARSLDLDLPRALDGIIARAMAKDPADRYQKGSELAADLDRLREQDKSGPTATWAVTTSASTATRKTWPIRPAPSALVRTGRAVRARIAHASLRDLTLAAAAVIALAIIGMSPKPSATATSPAVTSPAVTSPRVAAVSTPASLQASVENPVSPIPVTTSAAPKTGRKRGSGSADLARLSRVSTPSPPKQVIVPTSTVEISVQHQFKEATLWVWVDDKLALTRPLHGGTQKRMVLFNSIHGIGSETLTLLAGEHVLRLRMQTADQSIDLSRTISGTFISGDDKTLLITIDKHNTALHLNWQ